MSDTDTAQHYQVLARKYRPQTFDDLIGQDAMVRTLTNAFKSGRVAHAFMMTGVRGIGKTTTARLLARALNYKTDDIDQPHIDLSTPGEHCEAINQSRHVDVMEMDAASRTGVGDIREILEGVRYSPVSARYKVYIIDEVHMLSASAFNALLKTLEEPPDHAKFIFATTEIRKVPITVLSRCQRFDLRRVEAETLTAHLKNICAQENMQVDDAGLALIARAAEGSVRDALSLLDQAMVQRTGNEAVSAEQVRDMLGLADRARVLDLFEMAVTGRTADALNELKSQYDDGADPVVVVRDMMDMCHETSRAKTLGEGVVMDAAPEQIARIKDLAGRLSLGQLTRFWQMLLKAHSDVRMAPVPLPAAEMAVIRLAVAADLPPPEAAAKLLSGQGRAPTAAPSTPASKPAPQTTSQGQREDRDMTPSDGATALNPEPVKAQAGDDTTIRLESLDDVIALVDEQRDIQLKLDIEQYVRLIRFKPGQITIEPVTGMPQGFTQALSRRLTDWTGQTWLVSTDASAKGQDTIRDRKEQAKARQREEELSHPVVRQALEIFGGATLIEVRDRGGDVIPADFSKGTKKETP